MNPTITKCYILYDDWTEAGSVVGAGKKPSRSMKSDSWISESSIIKIPLTWRIPWPSIVERIPWPEERVAVSPVRHHDYARVQLTPGSIGPALFTCVHWGMVKQWIHWLNTSMVDNVTGWLMDTSEIRTLDFIISKLMVQWWSHHSSAITLTTMHQAVLVNRPMDD